MGSDTHEQQYAMNLFIFPWLLFYLLHPKKRKECNRYYSILVSDRYSPGFPSVAFPHQK